MAAEPVRTSGLRQSAARMQEIAKALDAKPEAAEVRLCGMRLLDAADEIDDLRQRVRPLQSMR